MADNISGLLSNIFSSVAKSAGTAVAKTVVANPTVQDSISMVQAELESAKTAAKVAGGAALIIGVFYFLPRFENPIPRIFRKRGRR